MPVDMKKLQAHFNLGGKNPAVGMPAQADADAMKNMGGQSLSTPVKTAKTTGLPPQPGTYKPSKGL